MPKAVQLFSGLGLDPKGLAGEGDSLAAEEMSAREHGRAVEQVMCYERDRAILRDFQETPLDPFVESPHRGPAPDLVVEGAVGHAGVGPA